MTPSYGHSTNNLLLWYWPARIHNTYAVNFYIDANPSNPTNQPFVQYLPGTSVQRTNVLENFFMSEPPKCERQSQLGGHGLRGGHQSSRPIEFALPFFHDHEHDDGQSARAVQQFLPPEQPGSPTTSTPSPIRSIGAI